MASKYSTDYCNFTTNKHQSLFSSFQLEDIKVEKSKNITLKITEEAFFSLHKKYDGDPANNKWLKGVMDQFTANGSLQIDVDPFFEMIIYGNIRHSFSSSHFKLTSKETQPVTSNQNLFDSPNEFNNLSLTEIMEEEEAMIYGREEIEDVSSKQEEDLKFLISKYPEIDQQYLQTFFEYNFCNLDTTIHEIENEFNFDNCSLHVDDTESSAYLNNSLSMSPVEDCRWKYEAKSPVVEFFRKPDVPIRIIELHQNEDKMRSFMENINLLVQKRVNVMKDMKKRISIRNGLNKNKGINQYTAASQDVKDLEKERDKISKQILKKYNEYNNGDNLVLDLHGLNASELNIVLPQFFRCKLSQIGNKKKIITKIVTGIGYTIVNKKTSVIRDAVLDFMKEKKLHYELDGPGAFKVTLYSADRNTFSNK